MPTQCMPNEATGPKASLANTAHLVLTRTRTFSSAPTALGNLLKVSFFPHSPSLQVVYFFFFLPYKTKEGKNTLILKNRVQEKATGLLDLVNPHW